MISVLLVCATSRGLSPHAVTIAAKETAVLDGRPAALDYGLQGPVRDLLLSLTLAETVARRQPPEGGHKNDSNSGHTGPQITALEIQWHYRQST